MKLPALVISAARLCAEEVSSLSAEIGMNRTALSKALGGGDFPPAYYSGLCAAVGLTPDGEGWEHSYVGRWKIWPGLKRGVPATEHDLIAALSILKKPLAWRLSVESTPMNLEDQRRITIARARGGTDSTVAYAINDGAVWRLLYVEHEQRPEIEKLLARRTKYQSIKAIDGPGTNLTDVWSQLSYIYKPADLHKLITVLQKDPKKEVPVDENSEALRRVAAQAGLSVEEVSKRLGLARRGPK